MDKLKQGDLKNVCNEKFGLCKKFNNYCKPILDLDLNLNPKSNSKIITKNTMCVYSLDIQYDVLSYCKELYSSIIFDRTDKNVYINNIIIEPSGYNIKFYIIDNVYILFDIYTYDNTDISNLTYIERIKYLDKLSIIGCTYKIIDVVKISQLKYYVNHYIQTLPFFKHIRYINFINDGNLINLCYKIKSSDYKINENIKDYEFYYTIEKNKNPKVSPKLKLYIPDIYNNNKLMFYDYGKLINNYDLTLKKLLSNENGNENKIVCKLINNVWTY
jgi:hypothetical protein